MVPLIKMITIWSRNETQTYIEFTVYVDVEL